MLDTTKLLIANGFLKYMDIITTDKVDNELYVDLTYGPYVKRINKSTIVIFVKIERSNLTM